MVVVVKPLGLYSLSRRISYHNISWTQSRDIGRYNDRIGLTFDRHLGGDATEVPVKFQNDCIYPNLAASRLHDILRKYVRPLSE